MKILIVDHDGTDIKHLTALINEFEPDAEVESAKNFDNALYLVNEYTFDLVFMTPDRQDKTAAVDFASVLKAKIRNIHIIFTSKSKKYMTEAFSVHADAYLIKPVTPEEINRELDYLMKHYPMPLRPVDIVVKTFGGFDVYYRGKKLIFKRSKAKELLALLIDNRGVGLTTREACMLLFDGRKYNDITLGYFHVVLTSLKATLEGYGIRKLLRKTVNYIAINTEMLDCDMYRYLKGDHEALADYHGDYMINYSWSEYSASSLKYKKDELSAV